MGISAGKHAKVTVSELSSGAQVSKLEVTNNGARPALLLDGLEGAGIAVELPHRSPELAHLTVWNRKHPLMEIA